MAVHDVQFASSLLDAVRSGLLAIRSDGSVAALNAVARTILGLPESAGEDALCDFRELLARQPEVAQLMAQALAGVERPSRTELVLRPRPGEPPRRIGFTLVAVGDPDGGPPGAFMQFRDLTPYERMDEQERLRDRLAALGQTAAALAHGLRNSLAAMEVAGGLLERRLADRPEDQTLVTELLAGLQGIAATLTGTLDYVRPAIPAPRPVDPVKLLEEALVQARSRVPFHGAVERRHGPDPPAVHADPEQLRAVLTDLIANALEAMSALDEARPRRLTLEVRSDGGVPVAGQCVISVSDTGPGISAELRERIFYPFFTTRERGSGVGLANAQKVVTSHGGAIEFDSREGEGTTFRIRLPVVEDGW